MGTFEEWWNRRSKFWKGMRTRDPDMALDALGYWRSPPVPGVNPDVPPSVPTPRNIAASCAGAVLGLIGSGLINHKGSLNEAYWRQVYAWFEHLDPAAPGVTERLDDLIEQWQGLATSEGARSLGPWDLMRTASFQSWVTELVAAAKQCRAACAEIQR